MWCGACWWPKCMMSDAFGILGLWVLEPDMGYGEAVEVALGRERPPDVTGTLSSSAGDVVRMRVAEGRMPVRGRHVYVERHGGFTVEVVEEWPPFGPGTPPRTLVMLRAWPTR
jgi:hypothetical protein